MSVMRRPVTQAEETPCQLFNGLTFDLSLISEDKVPSAKDSLTKEELENIIIKHGGHVVSEAERK